MNAPPEVLVRLQAVLLRVERSLALLEHCQPTNFRQQVRDAASRLEQGQLPRVEFQYRAPCPSLDETARALSTLGRELILPRSDPWALVGRLLVERVEELQIEVEMARARQTPRFLLWARRYHEPSLALSAQAEELAESWLIRAESEEGEPTPTEPVAKGLAVRIARRGLSIAVVEREIAAISAVSDEGIVVRRGATTTAREIDRLFVHEVFGHFLPRVRARSLPPPFAAGTRGANADEEGRALWLEERTGLLSTRRKRTLALRHLLAEATLSEQCDEAEVALGLIRRGLSPRATAEALCRCLRGGGLSREVMYLPGYLRVRAACGGGQEHVRLLGLGRVSVGAAQRLCGTALGVELLGCRTAHPDVAFAGSTYSDSAPTETSTVTGAWSEGLGHFLGV